MNNDDVYLRLMQQPNGALYWELKVRSIVKPQLLALGVLPFEKAHQGQKLGVLAGALAEGLCERYNDRLEPSGAARSAMELYEEVRSENPTIFPGETVM